MSDRPTPTEAGGDLLPNDDDLRSQLTVIGEQITVAPTDDDLIGVERVAGRRTRRRRAAAGLIGVGALIAGGAVLVTLNGDDVPDTVAVTADEPAEEPADELAEESSDGDGETDGDQAPGDDQPVAEDVAPPPPPPAAPASTGTVVVADRTTTPGALAPGEFVNSTVHPWQDGFLLLETTWQPQPLPTQFSEEISALFPEEVVELIEAEQPATINEATDLLTDAGLLDEVTAVLSEHPAASDAVFGTPPPPPEVEASFSTDGIDWEPIDYVPPTTEGMNQQLQSDGQRLVGFSYDFEEQGVDGAGPYFGGPPTIASITVVSTQDLRLWEEIDLPLPISSEPLPEFVVRSSFPMGFAVSEDGWAVLLDSSTDLDYEAVFADLLPLAEPEGGGFGSNVTDEGVALQRFDEQGLVEETVVTWEELGIDPISPELLYGSGPSQVITGTFDGVVREPVELAGYGSLIGVPEGFVRLGDPSLFSSDGLDWIEIEALDGARLMGGVSIRRGDELLVYGHTGPDEPMTAHALDPARLAWAPTSAPTLAAGSYDAFGPGMSANGVALYSVTEEFVPEPFEATASIEVDGYTFTQTMTHLGSSYAVIDPDGVEVVAESYVHADLAYDDDPNGPYDHLRFEPSGAVIVDPVTGETILEITDSELRVMWEQLAPDPVFEDGEQPLMPEMRLLATDGTNWIDEVLIEEVSTASVDDDVPPAWPNGAAVNDGVVLVAMSDGSFVRFEF